MHSAYLTAPGALTRDRYERMHDQELHQELAQLAITQAHGDAERETVLRRRLVLSAWLAQHRR